MGRKAVCKFSIWLPGQNVVRTFSEDIEEDMEIPIYGIPVQQRVTEH